MMKMVLKLNLHESKKARQKAMTIVSGISGVLSVSIDKDTMTVVGEVDAVKVTSKLRKICNADIVTLGENKEEKKEEKKEDKKQPDIAELERLYRLYYPHMYYPAMCVEESPNACTIC